MTERASRRAVRAARLAEDEAPIIAELAVAGLAVRSVYDFVGKSLAPDEAIPILLKHLGLQHEPNIREGIIRALGIPRARNLAFDPLRQTFIEEHDPTLRWVIANALSGMARYDEVADLPGIQEFSALFPKSHREEKQKRS